MTRVEAERLMTALLNVIDTRAAATYSKDSKERANQYWCAREQFLDILTTNPKKD